MRQIDKLLAIYDGYKNFFLGVSEDRVEEVKARALKCSSCAFNVDNICSKKVCDIIEGEKICGCGCDVRVKIKSFKGKNQCPKGLW